MHADARRRVRAVQRRTGVAADRARRVRHERRTREQLVPADDHVDEVKVVEEDLCDAHEHLALHAAVVAPHRDLKRPTQSSVKVFVVWCRSAKK